MPSDGQRPDWYIAEVGYGRFDIKDKAILDKIKNEMKTGGSIPCQDAYFGVDYSGESGNPIARIQWYERPGGPRLSIHGSRGQTLNFGRYVTNIVYGGKQLMGIAPYQAYNWRLSNGGSSTISNELMGEDPQVGVVKKATFTFKSFPNGRGEGKGVENTQDYMEYTSFP